MMRLFIASVLVVNPDRPLLFSCVCSSLLQGVRGTFVHVGVATWQCFSRGLFIVSFGTVRGGQ
jgi:hypothetical protein